jgi:hypothetical protein
MIDLGYPQVHHLPRPLEPHMVFVSTFVPDTTFCTRFNACAVVCQVVLRPLALCVWVIAREFPGSTPLNPEAGTRKLPEPLNPNPSTLDLDHDC